MRTPFMSSRCALPVQLRFDLELEVHLVTDDDDAGFEDRAEVAPKVTPVEPADGSGSGARARPRVGRKASQVESERDWSGDSLERELAVECVVVAIAANGGRKKDPRPVLVDLEEICCANVLVPIRVPGIDGTEIDGGRDARVEQGLAAHDLAAEGGEFAADLADHHVAYREPDFGVGRVDRPGADDVAGDRLFCCRSHVEYSLLGGSGMNCIPQTICLMQVVSRGYTVGS